MKLYRYLSEKELENILAGRLDKIGSFYDVKTFEKVNNHRYKNSVRYLHFYFDIKEISRVNKLGFQGRSICYICEFEIPFYAIFPHIGIGRYEGRGYDTDSDFVFEVALPANKMKQKYLISYEKDQESGPIDFGPIIKFDKRLYEPIYFENISKQENQCKNVYNDKNKDAIMDFVGKQDPEPEI